MEDLIKMLEYDFATAVEALDHHAVALADKVAIHYGETGEDVTYAQLAQRTDRVAGNLVDLGVEPGERISLMTTDPLVSIEVMYGIWKVRAVYAPINFQYQGHLLEYQIDDTRPTLLIVDVSLLSVVEQALSVIEHRPRLIVVDQEASDKEGDYISYTTLQRDTARPDRTVTPQDSANIIYTSGTTGPSKGVVQSHRWINGYIWMVRKFLSQDDVVYNDLPMYHVAGAHANAARALWVGASLVIWDRFSPNEFWERIAAKGCTTAVLLNVMIPWLMKVPQREGDRLNTLNKVFMTPFVPGHHEFASRFGVDFVIAGFGQSESGAVVGLVVEELPEGEGTPAHLWHGAGRAELLAACADGGIQLVDGRADLPEGVMGSPLPFLEVNVVDEDGVEVPPGVVGELVIRPKIPSVIFDEYLAKPEATVKAWRNLWFHTGDSVLRNRDGWYVYVDRLGDRIRVKGENVSSTVVEGAIEKHPHVHVAAAVAVPSQNGEEDEILAFVQLIEGVAFDESALVDHCAATMPSFMWPSRIVHVDTIPQTPTNKIEKYKLRTQYL